MSKATFSGKGKETSANPKAAANPASSGLRIGATNDAYEREADRVAEAITSEHGPSWSISKVKFGSVQRKCACGGSGGPDGECEECKRKREGTTLQRKATAEAEPGIAPPSVHEVLRSPGRPLDRATRDFFEPRFGYDLGHVRIHADAQGQASAGAVHAEAYTVGSDVAFAGGKYAPQTTQGRRLLAHELTHVVQQRSSTPHVQRQPQTPQSGTGLDPDDQKIVDAAQREASHFKCDVGPVLWGIIHKHFPDAGRKLAGTGCEIALPGLRTEFSPIDAKDPKIKRSVPMLYAGKAFIETTDAARLKDRVADVQKQIEDIDDWRVANFLIDENDLSNPRVTGQLRSMSPSQLVDYKQKNKNSEVQRYTENLLTFTTPTQPGSAVDPLSNEMTMSINGVNVVIKPDDRQVASVTGGDTSATLILDPPTIPAFNWDAAGKVKDFPGYTPTVKVEILTRYGVGAAPENTSGYGRGTTSEDVHNKATALRFHEGSHGEDYIKFVRENKVPVFTGTNGIPKDDFQQAAKDFVDALAAWRANIDKTSKARTDCVGTTIDQFHKGEKGYKNICP